jgi:hypothetical protein
VIKSVHIGQGLAHVGVHLDEAARRRGHGPRHESTTPPTLLLGGDPPDPDEAFASWEKALGLPSVRGLIVGRTLLYRPMTTSAPRSPPPSRW